MSQSNRRIASLWTVSTLILVCQGLVSIPSGDRSRLVSKSSMQMLAEPNSSKKQKIITPGDIASLFGESSSKSSNSDYDDDDDDSADYDYNDTPSDIAESTQKESGVPPIKSVTEAVVSRGDDRDSAALRELFALEQMAIRPPVDEDVEELKVVKSGLSDDVEVVGDVDLNYVNLDRVLDKATRERVMGMMTVTEAEDAIVGGSRIVKYDPTDTGRGDPMKYGAYRRWKLAEGELGNAGAKGRPKSLRQKSQKAQGGKPTSAQDKNKKGKGKGSLNADSFYNAIKKLGSGPASKDTATGTGVAEPPANMNPITPKKAPTRKNRKRVITPDDINNLFADKNKASADDDDDEDGDDYEDDEDEESESVSDSRSKNNAVVPFGSSKSSAVSGAFPFNPMMNPDEEAPQWIVDANKEAEKKKKETRRRKKKSLTDDWRFWTALIAGAGFASAFYNVYQQTGGFGSGAAERQELVI